MNFHETDIQNGITVCFLHVFIDSGCMFTKVESHKNILIVSCYKNENMVNAYFYIPLI